ncbi:formate dehydrogenase accessory sulfurtransferase FdhD [Zobellella endophytica]|uniref:Sulfur carrier protein FdhD n=1 Tax=Zobellella endophytica TaxID=2116700 RepID=A0A2P7RD60_9GAMM|nr:formate dehydrogenase accessory sulfurtransferase FdhD [Zobellella endophytica]PSJ48168.1 formate dehydrogenase accessory sulfurtransferase FdhD [Zobellella endophytica]
MAQGKPKASAPEPGLVAARVGRLSGGQGQDWVAEEVPVALVYNGISHAVMMASPLDLEDFALGFSLTEGIVERPGQVYGVEVKADPRGLRLEIELAAECFFRLKARRRSLSGRTGCGLCGTESLAEAVAPVCAVSPGPVPERAVIDRAFAELRHQQPLHYQSGATHAAAGFDGEGNLLAAREDVGRHNALDKLVGALARLQVTPAFVIVTSRASYEMVHKCAVLGAATLVAVSAPTSLAIDQARAAGLNLIGFARHGDGVIYT